MSHIRAVDAIFMMLRAFESADITHVEGDVNPVRDIEIINEELLLKVCDCCCFFVVVAVAGVLRLGGEFMSAHCALVFAFCACCSVCRSLSCCTWLFRFKLVDWRV